MVAFLLVFIASAVNSSEFRFLLFVDDGMLCNWCAGHHSFLPGQGSTAFASANEETLAGKSGFHLLPPHLDEQVATQVFDTCHDGYSLD